MHDERVMARLEERAAERVHEEGEHVCGERDEEEERSRTLLGECGRTIAVRREPGEARCKFFFQPTISKFLVRPRLTDAVPAAHDPGTNGAELQLRPRARLVMDENDVYN